MFNYHSDIDIAISGLAEGKSFFRLRVDIEADTGIDIDLMDLDECRFKELIVRQGVRIK